MSNLYLERSYYWFNCWPKQLFVFWNYSIFLSLFFIVF